MNPFATTFLIVSLSAATATATQAQNAPPPPPPPPPPVHRSGTPRPQKTPDPAVTAARAQALLQSPQRLVRLRAVDTLSHTRPENAPASLALMSALKDKDPEVRSRALKALKDRPLWQLPATSPLIAYLNSPDTAPEVQIFAMETLNALVMTGGPTGREAAPRLRAAAPRILHLMASPYATVRFAVLCNYNYYVANRAGFTQAVRRLLQDREDKVRFWAAVMYSGLTPPEAITSGALSLVLGRLRSPNANTRADTASTLANLLVALNHTMGPPMSNIPVPLSGTPAGSISAINDRITAALLPLTHDTDATVRNNATMALSVLRAENAVTPTVQAMTERLADKQGSIRAAAARYFIEHEGDFSSAAPALLQLVKTPLRPANIGYSPDVDLQDARNYAFIALGRIASKDEATRAALLALLLRPSEDQYGAFESLADASTEHPELASRLLGHLQEIQAPQEASPQEKESLQSLRARKLAMLMQAQKHRPETFSVLTQDFDRELPKVRQAALFSLVYQTNWTVDQGPGTMGLFYGSVQTKAALAYNWMANNLLQDKDPKIREYAAHGIAFTPSSDGNAIALLLPLLGDPEADVRKAAAYDLVRAAATGSFAAAMSLTASSSATASSDRKIPTNESLSQTLQSVETVVARLKGLPVADRAADYDNLLNEATHAQAQLVEVVKRRAAAPALSR